MIPYYDACTTGYLTFLPSLQASVRIATKATLSLHWTLSSNMKFGFVKHLYAPCIHPQEKSSLHLPTENRIIICSAEYTTSPWQVHIFIETRHFLVTDATLLLFQNRHSTLPSAQHIRSSNALIRLFSSILYHLCNR